jgi:8-oxo-dGTP pyrophosphatase MutT (NUDIX family)
MTSFRRVAERLVHRGHVWDVVVADFEAPDGQRFERDVVRSPGAVGVVPLLERGAEPAVVFVEQYRPALDRALLEIPAGMRDVPGEAPEVTAGRELAEEAGYRADRLQLLTVFTPSPGMTDSFTHIFLATGLTAVPQELHGPEEEHLTVVVLPLAEAVERVERGEIADAKTALGVLLTARRLDARW